MLENDPNFLKSVTWVNHIAPLLSPQQESTSENNQTNELGWVGLVYRRARARLVGSLSSILYGAWTERSGNQKKVWHFVFIRGPQVLV